MLTNDKTIIIGMNMTKAATIKINPLNSNPFLKTSHNGKANQAKKNIITAFIKSPAKNTLQTDLVAYFNTARKVTGSSLSKRSAA